MNVGCNGMQSLLHNKPLLSSNLGNSFVFSQFVEWLQICHHSRIQRSYKKTNLGMQCDVLHEPCLWYPVTSSMCSAPVSQFWPLCWTQATFACTCISMPVAALLSCLFFYRFMMISLPPPFQLCPRLAMDCSFPLEEWDNHPLCVLCSQWPTMQGLVCLPDMHHLGPEDRELFLNLRGLGNDFRYMSLPSSPIAPPQLDTCRSARLRLCMLPMLALACSLCCQLWWVS